MHSDDSGSTGLYSRRKFLGTLAAGVGGIAFTGEASASHRDRFDTFVDVVDEGADNDGQQSVSDVVERLTDRNDSIGLYFPPGRYRFDEQVFTNGYDRIGLFGNDATLVPEPAHRWNGEPRMFKLGTSYSPGNWLEIHDFTVDFSAHNTGVRAFQAQVNDLWVENVFVHGHHDGGTLGPAHFDVVDPNEYGLVRNFRAPAGGAYTKTTEQDLDPVRVGPTGIIVSPAHKGRIKFEDCQLGRFPDNGLYTSNDGGKIFVEGGRYRNSNVANIRLAGNGSWIKRTTIIVDTVRPNDGNQVGIRLDRGQDVSVANVDLRLEEVSGEAIKVTDDLGSATLENVDIVVDDSGGTEEAIDVAHYAGPVRMNGLDIEMRRGGQAIEIEPYRGDGDAPVIVEDTRVTGEADGGRGGSHAIRAERAHCEFRRLNVDQPGGDYRRAISVNGDDCRIVGGTYESTHHPVINDASGTVIDGIEARAANGQEAVKLLDGNRDVTIRDSVLYDGIVDLGTKNLQTHGNEYPS